MFVIVIYNNTYLFSLNRSEFNKNILNTKLYLVENNVMEDTLQSGDIAIINTKKQEYAIGDIILFKDQSGVKLERIMEIVASNLSTDEKKYITKADKSFHLNNFPINENMVIGKQTKHVSGFGWLLQVARSKITTIVTISILVIVLYILIQIRLYKPSRSQSTDEDDSLINQVKSILKKDKEAIKNRRGRHSRKVQKERTRRNIRDKSNKRNRQDS